nr:MAG TPA: hypothetical protein [Caudoviricetes sp.]
MLFQKVSLVKFGGKKWIIQSLTLVTMEFSMNQLIQMLNKI